MNPLFNQIVRGLYTGNINHRPVLEVMPAVKVIVQHGNYDVKIIHTQTYKGNDHQTRYADDVKKSLGVIEEGHDLSYPSSLAFRPGEIETHAISLKEGLFVTWEHNGAVHTRTLWKYE